MQRRLGRGLESLIRQAPPTPEPDSPDPDGGSPPAIPVDRVRPNPFQPRQVFDESGLEELRQSIERHGVLQPVVVRPAGEGYELVSGERRWRAARQAGLVSLPAIVREVPDREMLELALVENVQRRDLDAIEKAEAFRALERELGLTQSQIAQRVSLQRATVTNFLRLLELPDAVQKAVRNQLLSMGHARALLALNGERSQIEMMERAVRGRWSVRELEQRIRQARSRTPRPASPSGRAKPPWAREIEDRLRHGLGMKAVLDSRTGDRGRLVLEFSERKQLDRLLDALAPRPQI